MATSDGIAQIEKGLVQWGRVTNVISATQFQAPRLAEYGDGYFAFWTVYVLRDIRSTPTVIAAPQGEQQIATAFTQQGGIITHPAFTAPMVAGDEVLMIHPNIGAGIGASIVAVLLGLAALQADVGNASASALGSLYGILGDPATDLATSIATIVTAIGTGTGTSQGLFYYGVVTGAAAPSFTIATLAGLGDGKFADATAPYRAFVLRRAAAPGVAPQGEQQSITAYVSVGGVFTAGAFTAPGIAIGDEVLIIHPRLAEIANLITWVGYEGAISLANKLTAVRAALLDRLSIIAAGGANELTPARAALLSNLDVASSSIKTQTDKLANYQLETEWVTTPVSEQVADVNPVNLTPGSITPTFPAGSTPVRVLLVASIHAANQATNTHHIGIKVQSQKSGGGYADRLDLTAIPPIGLLNLDGAGDGWCGLIDVTAVVDTSAVPYDFRFVVDSDDAGAVNYTTEFNLVLVYRI
jgi:hypothetical protein